MKPGIEKMLKFLTRRRLNYIDVAGLVAVTWLFQGGHLAWGVLVLVLGAVISSLLEQRAR